MDHQAILKTNEAGVLTLKLNRPEAHNAFNLDLAKALGAALDVASGDSACRVVVIRGSERAFSAGGDLKLFDQQIRENKSEFREVFALLNAAIDRIRGMDKPVIAAIRGPAYAAGFGLALACDILVATHHSSLSPSFINVALSPNASSSYFLPRLIGPKRAAEAFMRARVYSASEALSLGILNHVWAEEVFEEELRKLAADLAARPRATLAKIKRLVNASLENQWLEQIELERELISLSSSEPDFAAGIAAFVAKKRK